MKPKLKENARKIGKTVSWPSLASFPPSTFGGARLIPVLNEGLQEKFVLTDGLRRGPRSGVGRKHGFGQFGLKKKKLVQSLVQLPQQTWPRAVTTCQAPMNGKPVRSIGYGRWQVFHRWGGIEFSRLWPKVFFPGEGQQS